ncbi:MAG: adenylate/guanylate cyclase domain-containing protein [Acidimicrobiia bacterium]|nr:adenylate/guanylate cyclase domain-containing protein [Acidimicrobiia bacterium]
MTCPNCSTENPGSAKFCMACGAALAVVCASCSTELPADASFCFNCGTAVGAPADPAARPAAEADEGLRRFIPPELMTKLEYAANTGSTLGERRTVTMLFCDVQGSTEAARSLDPEEWADIMNGAFEHLIAPVYRYEGTLARLMGDAILAFFGAPIGHEDDPERAVRAGLEIIEEIEPYREQVRREWGIDFDVRVGINTGLVVVGAIGSDLRVEYTAMGDAINLAARMEQTADPGTVRVTDETRRLVDRLFEFEDLGGVEVKGHAEPVPAFRVVRAIPRPDDLRGIEGLTAPLVGRDAELATLVGAIEDLRTTGKGRIVSIVAEAGLGKSRLVREARAALERSPEWHEGRSLSYETATPHAPLRRVLRSIAGLQGGESAAETWRRLEDLCAREAPGRVPETAPFLAWLLSTDPPDELKHRIEYLEPPRLRSEAFRAFVEIVERMASGRPVVLGFEDLHWADEASLELVAELLPVVERSMLGLVLLFRPRHQEGSWRIHETANRDLPHASVTIELDPLSEADTRTLVAELLAVDGLTDETRRVILDKSEGNPFYVEEIIRSMIDQGAVVHEEGRWVATETAAAFSVPDSLGALLTTRLDALDERTRRTAQAAAVVGRRFRYDELAAASSDVSALDADLTELQRRDLVREVTRIPKREFRFKHALTQEAAYETILLKRRVQLHAAVADFLVTTQPDRVTDIADHLVRARQLDRALPYLVSAGEEAARAYALSAATERLEMAADALGEDADADLLRRTLETLGQVREYRFDLAGAAQAYERLRDEGIRRGDVGMRVSGMNKLGLIRGFFFDERSQALEALQEAEAMAREAGDGSGLVEACMHQCFLRTGHAEFDQVEYYMGEVMEIGAELGQDEPTLFGMVHLANTQLFMTRYDEALEGALEALEAAEEAGALHFAAELLTFAIPTCHMRNGDFAEAMAAVERGMEIALRIGHRASEAFAAVFQGKVATAQGRLDQAMALFRRAAAAAAATGVPYMQALGTCVTGTCLLSIGGPCTDEALTHHATTLELMDQPTGHTLGAWLWTEVGHCALAVGNVAEAKRLFELALTEQTAPMWLMRPGALVGMIEVALAEGRLEDARETHQELEEYVTTREMRDQYATIPFMAGRIAAADGDHRTALARFAETEAMFEHAGMRRMHLDVLRAKAASLDALGEADEAATVRAEIDDLVREIGEGMEDPELRDAFLDGAGVPAAAT